MYARETIASIATPPGVGGIAIVRVSGADAERVARELFPALPQDGVESHRLYPGQIIDGKRAPIDRGLCVLMRAPRSYTGEDVVELHCHGGPLVSRRVLEAALGAGCRSAGPGEFTLRAFLNGKMDLAQAESVADLVAARTDAARETAVAQLEGRLSREVEAFRAEVIDVAAQLEVAIDFSEEDVGPLGSEALAKRTADLARRVRALATTFRKGRLLREGARVAIVGKPNVGKSSLLNAFLGTDRAIVTAVAGTTRDVIEETADFDGVPVVLVDTAGLRERSGLVERVGIERARAEIEAADAVTTVVDRSRPLEEADHAALDATRHKPGVIFCNKADLGLRIDISALQQHTSGRSVFEGSAKTGLGLGLLRETLAALFSGGSPVDSGAVTVTRERHRSALERAASRLEDATNSLTVRNPPDVTAVEVMAALEDLGQIVGLTSPEMILDKVFSEFCIGK